jgi:hypothetical protein
MSDIPVVKVSDTPRIRVVGPRRPSLLMPQLLAMFGVTEMGHRVRGLDTDSLVIAIPPDDRDNERLAAAELKRKRKAALRAKHSNKL